MAEYDFDVLIIGGGGSGGFTAATTAMKTHAKVGMIESTRLGGLCILAGCMPSKALIHSAEHIKAAGQSGSAEYPRVLQFKRGLVEHLAGKRVGAVAAKQKQGLEVIDGLARLTGPHSVDVDGREITADKLVIATGSTEIVPPVPGLAESGYLVSDSFMEMESLPASLVVLGGGTMALELSQYAARMGVAVTLIQRSETLLSKEDPRVGQTLAQVLADDGVEVLTGTSLQKVERGPGGVTVSFLQAGQPRQVSAEQLLLSLGRRPNTDGLNLEAAGVAMGKGGAVTVDRYMRTNVDNIFAAGDCTGVLMLVTVAIAQGQAAGYNATHDKPREVDDKVMPRAVFTVPEYASVGLTAAQANSAGVEYAEADWALPELAAAKTYPGAMHGFMTMRADKATGKIIGAELVAPHASLMIHDIAVAMRLGGTPADIASIPYVHPCLAEIIELTAGRLARELKKG